MSTGNPHFEVIRAATPCAIVVEIPHPGTRIDEQSSAYTSLPEKALAKGALSDDSDLGADLVWEGTESAGVTRVVAHASRYVIDLNTNPRPPPKPPFYEDGPPTSVIMRRSHCGMSWREQLPPKEERERRIATILEPYHAAVDEELAHARERHGSVCLVSAHTFPDPGHAIADVVLGTQRGSAASAALRDAVADVVKAHGFTVALEEPFPGGWSLTRHARPSEGIQAIQIEIARRLVTGVDAINGAPIDPNAVTKLQGLAAALIPALSTALAANRE